MRVLIVGGSDAGISAGLRIKELEPNIDVNILLRDNFPNYSICGLPFLISGETSDQVELAHRSNKQLVDAGLNVHQQVNVFSIDHMNRRVFANDEKVFSYDSLILATGARSRHPKLEGANLPGVFTLRWMGDAIRMQKFMETNSPRRALIVGGGYIGLEMADALHKKGLDVVLIEHNSAVLRTVHVDIGAEVAAKLALHGIKVQNNLRLTSIKLLNEGLDAELSDGQHVNTDLVLLAVGAEPSNELADSAGLNLGSGGAIVVDQQMSTSVQGIWAAGDCAETYHRLLGRNIYMPLGTNAHKQGRISGENAIGGKRLYQGTLGTQVVKVFDLVVARTGFRKQEAIKEAYQAFTVPFQCFTHKAYYPQAELLKFRVTGDQRDGKLLGAQMIGPWKHEVSKRLDTFANALFHGMKVDSISDLDLSYTPPLSSPWDPVQMAAQAWCNYHRS